MGYGTTLNFYSATTSPITLTLTNIVAPFLEGNAYTPSAVGEQSIVLRALSDYDPGSVKLSSSAGTPPTPLFECP